MRWGHTLLYFPPDLGGFLGPWSSCSSRADPPRTPRVSFHLKMLLFCCLPRTKVNTWASTHQLHCSEGFSDQLQHHKVNTSIECGSLSSGFLTWVGKGCGAASCLELLGSLEAEDLGCMKRSRFSLKISTESQPRKQNKIALLVTLQ